MAKQTSGSSDLDTTVDWEAEDVLSEQLDLPLWVSKNVKNLLDQGNTIPFIARYRKEQTNNMPVEKLREFQTLYESLQAVQSRVASVLKSIKNMDKLTDQLRSSIVSSQTLEEVEHVYAPYKPGSKRTLAERARELGLEPLAEKVIYRPREVDLLKAVQEGKKGLSTLTEVKTGLQHIIADIIAKDKATMDEIRGLCKQHYVMLECSKSRTAAKQEKEKDKKPANKAAPNIEKYDLYFNFSAPVRNLKSHQVLAINRGEKQKVLTVKIVIPDRVKISFLTSCRRKWIFPQATDVTRDLMEASIEDAYSRLIHPLMVRNFRASLTKMAEKASIEVFTSNLKQLLYTPPVRGRVVMGMDPGFRNGCKYAVTSVTGHVLATGVAYLHCGKTVPKHEVIKVRESLVKHRCETVAIGNGTACRETEKFFSDHIKGGTFQPLKISYCIVNESGASIYSASEEAAKELPDLDVSLRGAVSIARRLQDPLVELVKIEPKHIGVGMYQHDLSEKELKTALDGVVETCVSFVGVDINVCTEYLLRHVAGLNSSRAKKIIEWRDKNGAFISRDQLLGIKGIGPKCYEQCAGFVRILNQTVPSPFKRIQKMDPEESAGTTGTEKPGRKRKTASTKTNAKKAKTDSYQMNVLDSTSVHPESYHIAQRLLDDADVDKEDVGQDIALRKVKAFLSQNSIEMLADRYSTGVPTLNQIAQGLQEVSGQDIRDEYEKPLFREGLTSIEDLVPGKVLTGKVTNMTHFGAFVDIGVGINGLVHVSKMRNLRNYGKEQLELGDRVEVSVDRVEVARKRIGLVFQRLL